MTASNDHDLDFDLNRRLGDLFADGPTSAPERTIVFALDHAAAHPRGRDLLRAVRRDPMGSPAFRGSMRLLPLVAALGLLAIVALGAAFVGGAFNQSPAIAPPVVTPSPSTEPTAASAPVSTPVSTPTGPATVPELHVDLIEHVGEDASIDIVDRSGDLVRAASGDPGDGGSVEEGRIQVVADATDPTTLVLTWTGMPCDTTHSLDIAADHSLTITRPACSGDTLPVDHVLRLTFDTPVDPATVRGTVVTTGG